MSPSPDSLHTIVFLCPFSFQQIYLVSFNPAEPCGGAITASSHSIIEEAIPLFWVIACSFHFILHLLHNSIYFCFLFFFVFFLLIRTVLWKPKHSVQPRRILFLTTNVHFLNLNPFLFCKKFVFYQEIRHLKGSVSNTVWKFKGIVPTSSSLALSLQVHWIL